MHASVRVCACVRACVHACVRARARARARVCVRLMVGSHSVKNAPHATLHLQLTAAAGLVGFEETAADGAAENIKKLRALKVLKNPWKVLGLKISGPLNQRWVGFQDGTSPLFAGGGCEAAEGRLRVGDRPVGHVWQVARRQLRGAVIAVCEMRRYVI